MVTPTLCTIRIWHRHTLHMSYISAECDLRSRKYQRSTRHQHADPFALYSLARTARSEPPGRATHRSQPVAAQHFFTCTTKRMYELVRRRTARRSPWRTGVLPAVSKSMQCVEFWLPAPICITVALAAWQRPAGGGTAVACDCLLLAPSVIEGLHRINIIECWVMSSAFSSTLSSLHSPCLFWSWGASAWEHKKKHCCPGTCHRLHRCA